MILMYHKVHPNSPTIWWVKVNDFYRQMSELKSKEVVYLDDYEIGNPNQAVITFDGIYKNVLEYALPILKHFNYPFELFLTSDYIGLNNEFDSVEPIAEFTTHSELQELVSGGGRLQWHTRSHPDMKNIHDIETIIHELKIPEELLKMDTNGFKWFAYPHGNFNESLLHEVRKVFKGAISCHQGNDHDVYKLNRVTVYSNTILRENKIACIIASYNYGDFLIEAIESVLRQTIRPSEILISDDCSDDDTRLIAESYVQLYPDLIKYNRNDSNLGIVKHFNKAISLVQGEYVFFLGADNRLVSNYVEETSSILDSDKKTGVAYTDYAFFGTKAKQKFEDYQESRKGDVLENTYFTIHFPEFNSNDELLEELKSGNFIHGSSMFKKSAFKDAGGYIDSKMPEDYNLFKRIVEAGWEAKKANKTILEYRQHSFSQANNIVPIQNKMMLYKKMYEELQKNKISFELSKIYKWSYKFYTVRQFVLRNYKNPKKVLRKIYKSIFK